MMKRGSGVLMPISSLPSPYGIGTFGKAAYEFADFLQEAGQRYWQMLPLGPTSYGDSPYQSFSSFAGNPYFIDLDMLIEDELLLQSEVDAGSWGTNPRYVDYGQIYNSRFEVLRLAKERGWERDQEKVQKFVEENSRWIHDYALFMACKNHFQTKAWTAWDDRELRMRNPEALAFYRDLLHEDVEFYTYLQYLFFEQWNALKTYVHKKGIKIVGDVPIYVALDSVDVWAEPWFFQLDEENYPVEVSGVPPDYFSADGQLWGNPLYAWDRMEADGFGWWIRRIDGAGKLFDFIRIDHFRGLASYWAIPVGEKTAKNGHWVKGPGMKLVFVLNNWFHDLSFIAEDLGTMTPDVEELLKDSGWPGMKVLEFAFDTTAPSAYLTHQYIPNCICYTGTHDNATLGEWFEKEVDDESLRLIRTYLGSFDENDKIWAMIREGSRSVANLFVAQMQDYLELGEYNRINVPGKPAGNWQWRMLPDEDSPELAARMKNLALLYGRCEKKAAVVDDETDAADGANVADAENVAGSENAAGSENTAGAENTAVPEKTAAAEDAANVKAGGEAADAAAESDPEAAEAEKKKTVWFEM